MFQHLCQHAPVDVVQNEVRSMKVDRVILRKRSHVRNPPRVNWQPRMCLPRRRQLGSLRAERVAERAAFSARPRCVAHARQVEEILNKSGLDFRYGKRT